MNPVKLILEESILSLASAVDGHAQLVVLPAGACISAPPAADEADSRALVDVEWDGHSHRVFASDLVTRSRATDHR